MLPRGLAPLRSFVTIPVIPDNVRSYLDAEVNGWAAETQESLERHAEASRHRDNGQLLKALRDNPLSAAFAQPPPPIGAIAQLEANPPSRGRRIIL